MRFNVRYILFTVMPFVALTVSVLSRNDMGLPFFDRLQIFSVGFLVLLCFMRLARGWTGRI